MSFTEEVTADSRQGCLHGSFNRSVEQEKPRIAVMAMRGRILQRAVATDYMRLEVTIAKRDQNKLMQSLHGGREAS